MSLCPRCKIEKGYDDGYCAKCRSLYYKEWCEKNREKRRQTQRKWKKNNPEKVRSQKIRSRLLKEKPDAKLVTNRTLLQEPKLEVLRKYWRRHLPTADFLEILAGREEYHDLLLEALRTVDDKLEKRRKKKAGK